MIIVSAGIRARDELAQACGIETGERGGVIVNDNLQTSDPDIYAIGEVAHHRNQIYGLVAPGYDMADILAANLCGADRHFMGGDLSAKLKLMGIDVASFGDYEAPDDQSRSLIFEDPFGGIYKKLVFTQDGSRLLGGMLVGGASDYGALLMASKGDAPLPVSPADLIGVGGGAALGGVEDMADETQVCSCNNVTKGAICAAIQEKDLDSPAAVKQCTNAGTGCGGCMPLVTDLFHAEMKRAGKTVTNHLCEHFAYSRQELFEIVRIKQIRTFNQLIAEHGTGLGCETCKPAATSILASLWNEVIVDPAHATLQDSNDRFLANTQRGGLYSVIPRIPGGEITPEKLIVLGEVARQYNLYTKITGGQRVDLFGARLQDLPDIWEQLIKAGFESGHAYGKALRTVKSCVGSSWCRFGVQDSVKLAVEVERRYRGIRAPHKIKMAVSGCVRECAEAQSKDVGLIATEKGYNVYVCGNGGATPRHADLLAADLDVETALRYIDRFLIYYIRTADRLTRTSVWLEKLEGGIEHLRHVVIDDKLGLAAELEAQMQHLVDTYQCEWAAVVNDPEKRRRFRQFVNTHEDDIDIELVDERGQQRPAYWPKDDGTRIAITVEGVPLKEARATAPVRRVHVGSVGDFPIDGGAAVKVGQTQLAVFNFASRGMWYATQNMCPHKRAFVLSRGIIGETGDTPKVACPMHKKTFSLETGDCLTGGEEAIATFPVHIEGDEVWLELPPEELLDIALATEQFCVGETCASAGSTA